MDGNPSGFTEWCDAQFARILSIIRKAPNIMTDKRKAVIFDLDGCVSDDAWRRSRIPSDATGGLQFDFYHAGCGQDKPLAAGGEILRRHIADGHYVIFATARTTKFAKLTADWIKDNFRIEPNREFMLLMRQENDHRSSPEIKREMTQFIKRWCTEPDRPAEVVAAYDDRIDVVCMYREEGLPAKVLAAAGLIAHDIGFDPASTPVEAVAELREAGLDTPITQEDIAAANEALTKAGLRSTAPTAQNAPEETGHVHTSFVGDCLRGALDTFTNRQQTYGANDIMHAQVMKVLFPGQVVLESEADHRMFSFVNHVVGKLTRFASSGLTHADSAHDLVTYSAFMELLADKHAIKIIS